MTLPERVSIVGASGALGQGLARRWAAAGIPLFLGSRDASRAQAAATELTGAVAGSEVESGENAAAAGAAPVVAVAVPFAAQAQTYKSIADSLAPGTVILDATVPLATAVGGKPTRTLGVWQGSAAQQAAELVPDGVEVVSALHTVSAALLADTGHRFDEDVLVCGDDAGAKATVAGLVEAIEGLRAVDAGRLEQSRIAESLTALMIGINIRNKTHAGIRITGL